MANLNPHPNTEPYIQMHLGTHDGRNVYLHPEHFANCLFWIRQRPGEPAELCVINEFGRVIRRCEPSSFALQWIEYRPEFPDRTILDESTYQIGLSAANVRVRGHTATGESVVQRQGPYTPYPPQFQSPDDMQPPNSQYFFPDNQDLIHQSGAHGSFIPAYDPSVMPLSYGNQAGNSMYTTFPPYMQQSFSPQLAQNFYDGSRFQELYPGSGFKGPAPVGYEWHWQQGPNPNDGYGSATFYPSGNFAVGSDAFSNNDGQLDASRSHDGPDRSGVDPYDMSQLSHELTDFQGPALANGSNGGLTLATNERANAESRGGEGGGVPESYNANEPSRASTDGQSKLVFSHLFHSSAALLTPTCRTGTVYSRYA